LVVVGVSEANFIGNPTRTFLVHDGLGDPIPVTTPDIGLLMTDPAKSPIAAQTIPPPFVLKQFGLRLAFFRNIFKTPTLWGVKDTAPYFHDNSAKTLSDMLVQYDWMFANLINGVIELTPQDKEDIEAFLDLLRRVKCEEGSTPRINASAAQPSARPCIRPRVGHLRRPLWKD
jgi:cytochrome c peroxidase